MARSKETSEEAAVFLLLMTTSSEWRGSRLTGGILFTVVHLLLELLRLLLVDKAQPSYAFFELERVEKGAVLVVAPCIEDFLVPDHATRGR
jgi:hypothetical protein